MQPLNAIDAIAPAFTRTHAILFHPFQLGRSWKLAASQYLGFCGSMFVPWPLWLAFVPHRIFMQIGPAAQFIFVGIIILSLISLMALYLCARMELVAFEMIVTRNKFIKPMWRNYPSKIWPWLAAKMLAGLLFGGLVAALLYLPLKHAIQHFIAAIPASTVGQQVDPAAAQQLVMQMLSLMISLQALSYLLFFLIKIPSTLFNDFVLPYYLLEDVSISRALRRGLEVFLADPMQMACYLLLKPILSIVGFIMQSIAVNVCMIPFIVVFAIGAAIAGVSWHHAGPGGSLLIGLAGILLLAIFFLVIFYLSIGGTGYVIALLEAYGIYFLAGRYPLLNRILDPTTFDPGAPFTPPPVFPSRDERSDDDGGPPMPMDPAIA